MLHAFRDFEIDEERFELRRNGQPVRVEPRVLEVLMYLVRNRGRIVAKEELLDQVWKKTFVSESALTRCIMEGRRAIGDPGRAVPLIKTVHGRGYRFDPGDDPEPALVPPVPVILEDVSEPASRRPLVAVAAVLAALVLVVAIWRWIPRSSPAPAPETVRLALLPISIDGDDRELQLVSLSLADLLEQRLAKVPRLHVRGADYSRPLSESASSLPELAARAGVSHIISGSVHAMDDRGRARLTLTLHEVRDAGVVRDTPLGAYEIPLLRESQDIRRYAMVRDRVVSQVVATVRPAFQAPDGTALTPSDSEAYRYYLLARERLAAGVCDGEAAMELLRRSLERDPRFAPAWVAYAWAQYGVSSACTGGSRYHQGALAAAERALALSPSFGSALALKSRIMTEKGKVEEAYALLRTASAREPSNVDLQSSLAAVLSQAGFVKEAQHRLARVIEQDPNYLTQRGMVPTPFLVGGDVRRFLRVLPGSDTPLFRYQRGFAEMVEGRNAAAYRALEPAFRLNPADAHARLSHALLAVIEGRPEEAREIVRQLARQREVVGETDAEMTYRIAQIYALAGDADEATRQLRRAVDQGFFCAPCIERDSTLSTVRGTADARAALELARKRHLSFAAKFGLRPEA